MLLTIEKVAILKSADIFAETPEDVLVSVASIVEHIELEAGETFIHKGELEDDMFIIVDGQVLVHDDEREIGLLVAGEVVGEMAALDPAPRLASVTATEETRLFRIEKDAFDEVLIERPEIALGIIRVLIRRLREAIQKQ